MIDRESALANERENMYAQLVVLAAEVDAARRALADNDAIKAAAILDAASARVDREPGPPTLCARIRVEPGDDKANVSEVWWLDDRRGSHARYWEGREVLLVALP